MRLIYISLVLTLLCLTTAFTQSNKAIVEAQRLFGAKNYAAALPKYLEGIQGIKDPLVFYQLATCYKVSESVEDQVKGIQYFEQTLTLKKDFSAQIYFDLGELYLKDEQLQKAMDAFQRFRENVKADKKLLAQADKTIGYCQNAIAMMSVPRNFTVHSFSETVNTKYTEYNPVVSADESVLAFTALRPNTGRTRSGDKFIEEIYVSYNKSGNWTEPTVVPIASEYNVGTAGMSADGQKMVVFMGGNTDPGNLFLVTKSGDVWSKPSILSPTINSMGLESTSSLTPDGKVIYFASDRQGGKGGLDIWKIELKSDGKWSPAINLGPDVNTKDNEDAPFIHPDQKTLFFTSDGHSTMGGRDIFKTSLVNGKWIKPENMGYPVNTTSNDNYFTLLADGKGA
ncbi:MAG: hypothetical protein ORN54_10120, partial [Cyclobacteriaceae bacterium]|nr:hypothetical protein [Cyclobacteriaceae bacterium]